MHSLWHWKRKHRSRLHFPQKRLCHLRNELHLYYVNQSDIFIWLCRSFITSFVTKLKNNGLSESPYHGDWLPENWYPDFLHVWLDWLPERLISWELGWVTYLPIMFYFNPVVCMQTGRYGKLRTEIASYELNFFKCFVSIDLFFYMSVSIQTERKYQIYLFATCFHKLIRSCDTQAGLFSLGESYSIDIFQ